MDDNKMRIWNAVEATDPNFTKKFELGGFRGTAIVPQYLIKKATELFGPAGIKWGYELTHSEIVETAMIRIAGVDAAMGRVHTARLRVWFEDPVTQLKGEVFGTGHTPFVYLAGFGSANERVVVDMEYEKKSITDALTKALSLLGFGADVRMGLYEHPGYIQELQIEGEVDREAAALKAKAEFEAMFERAIDQMNKASDLRTLEMIFKLNRPHVQAHGTPDQRAQYESAKNVRARALLKLQKEAEMAAAQAAGGNIGSAGPPSEGAAS